MLGRISPLRDMNSTNNTLDYDFISDELEILAATYQPPIDLIQYIIILILMIIGIPLNLIIVSVSVYYWKSMPSSNLFIANLAVADCIFLLHGAIKLNQLEQREFKLGTFLCYSNHSIKTAFMLESVFLISILAFDRYQSINHMVILFRKYLNFRQYV